jgi:hypothetical protein
VVAKAGDRVVKVAKVDKVARVAKVVAKAAEPWERFPEQWPC